DKSKANSQKELDQIEDAMEQLAANQKIEEAGWTFLEDGPSIIKGAEATESLAIELVRVKNQSKPKSVPIKWTEGRKIILKIANREASVNTLPTQLKSGEWVFSASPDLYFRFVTGLSLMYAHDANFKKFEEGEETGTTDKRFLWALTLGVIPRPLDFREPDGSGWAGGVDFHLNPSDTERALGVGLFASWHVFKISVGGIAIKHQYLRSDGVADTYSAKPYIAFSVVGWPPFEAN
ncbi:MAG TPA: hypothetical protein VEU33_14420, partial [Archangium sp.]|nr:hypothetical protein [Archangium sp.]